MSTWFETALMATTVTLTPPADVDTVDREPRLLVCEDMSAMAHLYFTKISHRPSRAVERGCATYATRHLELVNEIYILVGFESIELLVYQHLPTRTIVYGFAE